MLLANLIEDRSNAGSAPRPLAVHGASGSGKSAAVRSVIPLVEAHGNRTVVLDFNLIASPSRVSVVSEIARQISTYCGAATLDMLAAYEQEPANRRATAFERVVDLLQTDLTAVGSHQRVAIFLDGVDYLGTHLRGWIFRLLAKLPAQVATVALVSSLRAIPTANVITIAPIGRREIASIAAERGIDVSDDICVSIQQLTRGNFLDVNTSLEYLKSSGDGKFPHFESMQSFISSVMNNLSGECRALLQMLANDKIRYDEDLLRRIDLAAGRSIRRALPEVSALPFVRPLRPGEPIMAYQQYSRVALSIGELAHSELAGARRAIFDFSGEMLATELTPTARTSLVADRLSFQLLDDANLGMGVLTQQTSRALSQGDLDHADALISAGERVDLPADYELAVGQLRARYLIESYASTEARGLLAASRSAASQSPDSRLLVNQLLLEARCVANPSPIPHGDLFDAITTLRQARELSRPGTDDDLLASIHFTLGRALRATGQSEQALTSYDDAALTATRLGDNVLAVEAMQETVQTLRYIQDLPNAESALNDVYRYKGEFEVQSTTGVLEYYTANLRRDQNNFGRARELYESAKSKLEVVGDDNGVCCLLADWAWLEFLDDDFDLAHSLQDESFALASRHRFGAEIAEYWHTKFHLAREIGEMKQAYEYLENGLREARRSSNIYMVLDCSMHTAERMREEGNIDGIRDIIAEMEAFERRGCGIRVFRGRTLMILGDALFAQDRRSNAFDSYREGLAVVARFGNSRSNAELFADIISLRWDNLLELLDTYGLATAMREFWINEELNEDYPQVIELCGAILSKEGEFD
ncbi:tetratricopeptide repeat protein [Subtercola lobariae]